MKQIFTLIIVLSSAFSMAQKAKSDAINCKYHHIRYPQNVELSAKIWAMTITEQSSCQGAVPFSVTQTPLVATNPRSQFYMNLVSGKGKDFYQVMDNIKNLDLKRTPYIHFELNTSNITVLSQATKNKKPAPDGDFYLLFEMRTPLTLVATRKGDMNVVLMDTNNLSVQTNWFRFPQDAGLGTAPDIKPNGYPNEAELLAAWRKYGKDAEMKWRDRMITDFLRVVYHQFTEKYIQFEAWDVVKIYSDKNKNGGFDDIVNAAETFRATVDEIDADFKAGIFTKFYTDEYQTRLLGCVETWKSFLAKHDFDVTTKDGDVSDEYKQEMLTNYIHGLIFTKQFEQAQKQIAHYLTQDIRSGTSADLKNLRELNTQVQAEYTAHAERLGWK